MRGFMVPLILLLPVAALGATAAEAAENTHRLAEQPCTDPIRSAEPTAVIVDSGITWIVPPAPFDAEVKPKRCACDARDGLEAAEAAAEACIGRSQQTERLR